MRSDQSSALLIGALCLIAIVASLALVGGPGQGRREQEDGTRQSDLVDLVTAVKCRANADSGRLPETLAELGDCKGDARLSDPFTGEPYVYEKLSDKRFKLCAKITTEVERYGRTENGAFDPATGCRTAAL